MIIKINNFRGDPTNILAIQKHRASSRGGVTSSFLLRNDKWRFSSRNNGQVIPTFVVNRKWDSKNYFGSDFPTDISCLFEIWCFCRYAWRFMDFVNTVWPHPRHMMVNVGTPGQGAAALSHDLCMDSLVPVKLHLVIVELCTIGSLASDWVRSTPVFLFKRIFRLGHPVN